jgi:hypothetical protein
MIYLYIKDNKNNLFKKIKKFIEIIMKINQHNFLYLYSSNTFYLSLFFVSTIKYWFMKSEKKHHKKKNVKGINFIFTSLLLFINGKPRIQRVAPNKLEIVEYGIMFGYTI